MEAKKIFKFQFQAIGIALLACIAIVVGTGVILSLTLGPGDGLGALAVAVFVLPILGVIFLAILFILGIWGLVSIFKIQKLNPQGLLDKLSFIFSSLLTLLPLILACFLTYEFYILPQREFADNQRLQDKTTSYKKGLIAEFSQPQIIQDVNTQFVLEDPLTQPKFFSQPEFILQSGKRILSADFLWGCNGSQDKINNLANSLKGKMVQLEIVTWYGGEVPALWFISPKGSEENQTLHVSAHIYVDGILISCDSIQ